MCRLKRLSGDFTDIQLRIGGQKLICHYELSASRQRVVKPWMCRYVLKGQFAHTAVGFFLFVFFQNEFCCWFEPHKQSVIQFCSEEANRFWGFGPFTWVCLYSETWKRFTPTSVSLPPRPASFSLLWSNPDADTRGIEVGLKNCNLIVTHH